MQVELDGVLSAAGIMISAAMMVIAAVGMARGGARRDSEGAERLARVDETTSKTYDRLVRMEARMDDHSAHVAALDAARADHERRISRIEDRCEGCAPGGVGGTE